MSFKQNYILQIIKNDLIWKLLQTINTAKNLHSTRFDNILVKIINYIIDTFHNTIVFATSIALFFVSCRVSMSQFGTSYVNKSCGYKHKHQLLRLVYHYVIQQHVKSTFLVQIYEYMYVFLAFKSGLPHQESNNTQRATRTQYKSRNIHLLPTRAESKTWVILKFIYKYIFINCLKTLRIASFK